MSAEDDAVAARVVLDRKTGHVTVMAAELDDEGEQIGEYDDTPEGFGRIAATTATPRIGTAPDVARRASAVTVPASAAGATVIPSATTRPAVMSSCCPIVSSPRVGVAAVCTHAGKKSAIAL